MQETLRVTEIFLSLQGESQTVGLPTVFVRLTGCPLRCHYCDTSYAFGGGQLRDLEEILLQIADYSVHHVCITGGEPLAQPECLVLLKRLCDRGYAVSLETSGALCIADVDSRVSRVMDLKTPDSGEMSRNHLENLALLQPHDQLKWVICSRADYDWAVALLREHRLDERVNELLFSPCHGRLAPQMLAEWILADRLPVRFQLQLHKLLWQDAAGR